MADPQTKARFIEPMLLVRTNRLPEGAGWEYEVKLDGDRAIAFRSGGHVHLRSRNDKDFGGKYSGIVEALSLLPDETVINGEVVALDEAGRPSFNAHQNCGSPKGTAVIRTFRETAPSPRASIATRQAATVALVKPGRGLDCTTRRTHPGRSCKPVPVIGQETLSSTRDFRRRQSAPSSTIAISFI